MAITVKRAETTVEFCSDLSLQSEWEAASGEFADARRNPSGRMADPEVRAAAEKVRELEDAMEAAILVFKVRALPRKRWQELIAAHPKRDDSEQDETYGVNVSTFFDAVASEPGSIYAVNFKATDEVVDFDPSQEWSALADDMTDGQYNDFVEAFLKVNRLSTTRPFSRAASLAMKDSDAN